MKNKNDITIGIIVFAIILLIILFTMTGCSNKSHALEVIKVRECQLKCLQNNMSYDGQNNYIDDDNIVQIQCKCIAYIDIDKNVVMK